MNARIQQAATQFGTGIPVITPLGNGLIHTTGKAVYEDGTAIVLQCINQKVFPEPEKIIHNYLAIYKHLSKVNGTVKIAAAVPAHNNSFFWIDAAGGFWRATKYMEGTYWMPAVENETDAYKAASCYAAFTASLATMEAGSLHIIIPDFHNIAYRYDELETAIRKAAVMRLLRATHLISGLRQRKALIETYRRIQLLRFPERPMHHDCKISNILFNLSDSTACCPVDLDTVMPGKYFSDVGDMIRSMVCFEDENSTAWENIMVRKAYYHAVIAGYLQGMDGCITEAEKEGIHVSGVLMTCMQAIRYLTDYLNNDVYYQTTYAEQNLNRAFNQFILLEQLELFLLQEYGYSAY